MYYVPLTVPPSARHVRHIMGFSGRRGFCGLGQSGGTPVWIGGFWWENIFAFHRCADWGSDTSLASS